MDYYDRYKNFKIGNELKMVQFCEIPMSSGDLYIKFDKSTMRMDNLSYRYYNDPNYGWLILQANPHLPSMEFSIPDGVILRIPYPLTTALKGYEKSFNKILNESENI